MTAFQNLWVVGWEGKNPVTDVAGAWQLIMYSKVKRVYAKFLVTLEHKSNIPASGQ
jgi:hypothetical protein